MEFGYFDSEAKGFDDATGMPIFDRAQNADFMADMFSSVWGNGVYPNPSTNLQVMERDDSLFGVKVMPGKCWVQGRYGREPNTVNFEFDAASTTADRIDIVVIELDKPNRMIALKVVKGTPATTPAPPALVRTSDIYQLCLAQCKVRKNASKVNQSDITDTRMDNSLCGYVTGVITQIDGSTLFTQIQAMINGETQYLEDVNKEVREFFKAIQNQGYLQPSVTYSEIGNKRVFDAINEIEANAAPRLQYSNNEIFVSNVGSDSLGYGFSIETPFRTLQYALNNIPYKFGSDVSIIILDDIGSAARSYIYVKPCNASAIHISGLDAQKNNYVIKNAIKCSMPGIDLSICNIRIDLISYPTSFAAAVYMNNGRNFAMENCTIAQGNSTVAQHGVAFGRCTTAYITNTQFSQCKNAIMANDGAVVRVSDCSGSNYDYGLRVDGGIIIKSGTVPSGNIAAQFTINGGQIFG